MKLFVDHLCNIDCSCLDQEFGLIGASWIVDIIIEGDLNHQGMVMDFGDVKQHIKKIIDDSIDHTLIIANKSSNVTTQLKDSSCKIEYSFSKGIIEHSSPIEAVSLIETDIITIKILEEFLEQQIIASLPDSSFSINIKLREEHIDGANYVYSHGLKQHEGNCQRIAHGHRSQIKIISENKRLDSLEQEWSNLWNGKYLANKIDVKKYVTEDQIKYIIFKYHALQGEFTLKIPEICCYLIDNETTIEYLSQHICTTLGKQTGQNLQVFAYEGVNKGAISYTETSS